MPKRKRPSPSPAPAPAPAPSDAEQASNNRTLSRQKPACMQILVSAQRTLITALRLGAGFERQKFSRRRKTAKEKKDEKAVARLDAEYAVLKGLDIAKVAEQHLRKTIAKVKSLKEHEGLPESVREIEKGEKDAATLNTLARLYKVQGVKKTVDACIDDLKRALGLAVMPGKETEKAKKKDVEDDGRKKKAKIEDEEMVDANSGDEGDDFTAFDACIAAPSSADEDSDDSLSLGNRPPSVVDAESGDEEESTDDEDDSDVAIPRNDDIYSGGESDDDAVPLPKSKAKAVKAAEKVSSSTFIPSLSHAGYISGSESEAEDLDIDIAPKKNRRGQRARQKIWEKKYGDKAKHKEKESRNAGWDAKRGAVDDRGGRGSGVPNRGRGPQITGENATELGPRKKEAPKRDDTGSLHPSWLAAKAAKEKKLAAKPAGTKITFD